MKNPAFRAAGIALLLLFTSTACHTDPQVKKQKYFAKGKAYMEQKKYVEAKLEFENAAKIDPHWIDPFLMLAQVNLRLKDFNHTYQSLQQVLKIDPDNFEANRDLSGLMMNVGRYKEARVAARKALAVKPNDPKANEYMAYIYQGLGDFKSMEKGLESVLQQEPSSPAATLTLLRLKMKEKDMEGIQEILERAAEKATDSGTHTILGNYYAINDKMPEAEKEYRKAISIDPKSLEAKFALARFFERNKRMTEAEDTYRTAAREHDDDPEARGAVANFFTNAGQPDKAIVELQDILKRHPDDSLNRSQLITTYWKSGQTGQAIAQANEVLKKNPKDNKALMVLAIINVESGKTQEAMSQLQTVLHYQPDNGAAHYFLAKAYDQKGQLGPAKQEVQDAIKQAPGNLAARMYLAELLMRTDGGTAAIELLRAAPAPQNLLPNVQLQIVKAELLSGDLPHAAIALARLHAINPHLEGLQTEIGEVLGGMRKFPEAQAAFKRALMDNPADSRAITGLATTYMAQKQSAAGETLFETMVKNNPHMGSAAMSLARIKMEEGKTDAAIKDLETYMAGAPNDLVVMRFLGQAHYFKGDLPGTEAIYRKMIQLNAGDAITHFDLAGVLEREGKNAEAIQEYKVSVGLNPGNPAAANNLAWLLAETGGNIDDALKLAQTAKEKYPNSPAFSDTLGWILVKKNNPTAAVKQLTEAVQQDPKNPAIQYHLAYAYWRTGDAEKAEKALQASLSMKVNFKQSDDARQLLRDVQAKLHR